MTIMNQTYPLNNEDSITLFKRDDNVISNYITIHLNISSPFTVKEFDKEFKPTYVQLKVRSKKTGSLRTLWIDNLTDPNTFKSGLQLDLILGEDDEELIIDYRKVGSDNIASESISVTVVVKSYDYNEVVKAGLLSHVTDGDLGIIFDIFNPINLNATYCTGQLSMYTPLDQFEGNEIESDVPVIQLIQFDNSFELDLTTDDYIPYVIGEYRLDKYQFINLYGIDLGLNDSLMYRMKSGKVVQPSITFTGVAINNEK